MTEAGLPPLASATITCIIADDHQMVRRGLVATLEDEDDFRVVAEASSGSEAIDMTRHLRPHLVILDVNMLGSGLDACRSIKAEFPEIHTVLYSFRQDPGIIRASEEAGASGYLVKGISGPVLVGALRNMIAGCPFFLASLPV